MKRKRVANSAEGLILKKIELKTVKTALKSIISAPHVILIKICNTEHCRMRPFNYYLSCTDTAEIRASTFRRFFNKIL